MFLYLWQPNNSPMLWRKRFFQAPQEIYWGQASGKIQLGDFLQSSSPKGKSPFPGKSYLTFIQDSFSKETELGCYTGENNFQIH